MSWTSFALRFSRNGISVLLLPLFLFGCATVIPPSAPDPAAAEQAAARPYQNMITIGGRLSVQYQQNARDEAIHGSFSWVQRADNAIVTLFSPLGQTIAIIEITPTLST